MILRPRTRRWLLGTSALPAALFMAGCDRSQKGEPAGTKAPAAICTPGNEPAPPTPTRSDRTLESGKRVDPAPPSKDNLLAPHALAISPDGTRVAGATAMDRRALSLADSFGTVIWDAASGEASARFEDECAGRIAWHPGGEALAIGAGNRLTLTDLEGKPLWHLTGHGSRGDDAASAEFHDLRFAPDGDRLVSVHSDDTVRLWTLSPDACEPGHDLNVGGLVPTSAAFSPDGTVLAVSGKKGAVQLWDVAAGTRRGTAEGFGAGLQHLVYTAGSTLVASDPRTYSARALRADGTGLTLELEGNRADSITALGDDQVAIAVPTAGRTVVWVWDTAAGTSARLPAAPGAINALSGTPDGSLLVGVAPKTGLLIWDGTSWREAEQV